MAVDPHTLRRAMRRWPSGVTVVTSRHQDDRHGMTVSSFSSISLTPPLVLVSLERGTRTHQIVRESGIFGVTILTLDQHAISNRFAGRETETEDRFAGLEVHTLETGAPLLEGGLVCLDCQVDSILDYGTHAIVVGEVVAVRIDDSGEPLLYFNREYRRLQAA